MARSRNYGVWPLFREDIEPSRLNSREPIGMKTPHVESLTSYFTRLSWSHCLSPGRLFAAVVAPLLDKTYLSKRESRAPWLSRSFRARSAAINSIGRIAVDWVTLLEKLTGRTDLQSLTFLPWAGILSQRNLLRPWRAWCAVCIHEWNTADKQLYEPLLWSVKLVSWCVVHNVPLTAKCPSCKAVLHFLSHGGRPGYCNVCGMWLGASQQKFRLSSSDSAEVSPANMIGELLAESSLVESSTHSTWSSVITSLIKDATANNASRFALRVGRNKSTISGWVHGSRIPLGELVDLSIQLKTTPLTFLSGSPGILETDNTLLQIPRRKPAVRARKPFNERKVSAELEKSITHSSPRSMQHLAKTLRVDKRVLYRHFPQRCKEIAAQAGRHRRSKAA